MKRTHLLLTAAGGSLALLLGAFGFQALGYAPCEMCLWQRYPHAAAIVLGAAALALPGRALPLLGALAVIITGGIGVFHVGVEQHWWQGITECTGTDGLLGLSGADLINQNEDLGPPLVRCDQATYILFLSMAAWNAILSFALVIPWLLAARASRA